MATGTSDVPQLIVQTGHHDFARSGSLYWVDDGRFLVSVVNGVAILWDFQTGRQIRSFDPGVVGAKTAGPAPMPLPAFDVRHDVDMRSGMTGQENFPILWDGKTGGVVRKFSMGVGGGLAMRFSPRLGYVASTLQGNFDLWHATGVPMHLALDARTRTNVDGFDFSRDEHFLALHTSLGRLQLWDVRNGNKLFDQPAPFTSADVVALARDNQTVVIGASGGREVAVVDLATGKEVLRRKFKVEGFMAAAFSPRSDVLALATDRSRIVIDLAAPDLPVEWPTSVDVVASMIYDDAGRHLVEFLQDLDGGSKIVVRDSATGNIDRTMGGEVLYADRVDASRDSQRLLIGNNARYVSLWDTLRNQTVSARSNAMAVPFWPFFGGDSSVQAIIGWLNQAQVLDLTTARSSGTISRADTITGAAVSPDFSLAAHFGMLDGSGLRVTNLQTNATRDIDVSFIGTPVALRALAFFQDNRRIVAGVSQLGFSAAATDKIDLRAGDLTAAEYHPPERIFERVRYPAALVIDATTGETVLKLSRSPIGGAGKIDTLAVAVSTDDRRILTAHTDGQFTLWDAKSGSELATFPGSAGSLAFLPDGRHFIAADHGVTSLWDLDQRQVVAQMFAFPGGGWAVTDPAGHFDTDDLEQVKGLHWSIPDDPLAAVPVEAFMRDYYEPRLLQRILKGEKFPAVRNLAAVKRVQPVVRISGVAPDPHNAGRVLVAVEADGASQLVHHGTAATRVETAAHDLRLFRNGQLVGYADGDLTGARHARYRHTFSVALAADNAPVEFTAYAFNDDRVKSATAHLSFTPPESLPVARPRAWIITVGINQHENPDWNLHYAVNDAQRISQSVVGRLKKLGLYQDVVPVMLVSDGAGADQASKHRLKAVMDRLSGRPADVAGIAGAERLDKAGPDDLVLISFSGHGVTVGGQFYLVPSDTGPGQVRRVDAAFLAHAISADELALWLRDVDGGPMAMVIDACQSAASVGAEFKPGPMGSRGLGQLAYEKGMRILAASQADESAQESQLTQQGLLSYALVNDGLELGKADFQPVDQKISLVEWLSYAAQRVPVLADEVANGKVAAAPESGERGAGRLRAQPADKAALQRPALFDFSKGRRDAMIVE